MRRVAITAAAAAAVAVAGCVLLAACSSSAKPALSAQYVQRANGVCDQWTKALNQLGFSPPLADANRMVSFTTQQLSIDRTYTQQFVALPATSTEQPVLAPIIASFNAINDDEAGVLKAAQTSDRAGIQTFHQQAVNETTKVNVTLNALGLKVCAAP